MLMMKSMTTHRPPTPKDATMPVTRLSDAQVRQTVAAMRMTETLKAALLRQALAGDAPARFVVYAKWRAGAH